MLFLEIPGTVTDLPSLLTWLIKTGGAGILSYWIIDMLDRKFPVFAGMGSAWRRVMAMAMTAGIALLAALLGQRLGFFTAPSTAGAWIDLACQVIVASQISHGFLAQRANQSSPPSTGVAAESTGAN